MKISVVIPVYNVEEHLSQCLASVLGQTYRSLEIILMDDGSTDNSLAICKKAAEKDARVIVLSQDNAGVSVARNKGIQIATGQYITFVDSDDWLEPEMYARMCNIAASDKSADVIMCDYKTVDGDNTQTISATIESGLYIKAEIISKLYPMLLVTENFGRLPIVSVWNCLFRRSLLIDNHINFDADLRYSEDYLFMADVMTKAESFYYLKNWYFYNYRQYGESRSKKYNDDWWRNLVDLNRKLKFLLSSSNEFDFTRQLKLQLIHSALFLSSAVVANNTLQNSKKLSLLKTLFNDRELKQALSDINFDKQQISIQIVLLMMKKRNALAYLVYRNVLSKIR